MQLGTHFPMNVVVDFILAENTSDISLPLQTSPFAVQRKHRLFRLIRY